MKETIERKPLQQIYGINAFTDATMKELLPKSIYKEIKKVQAGLKTLTLETAEVVANAMKDWAIGKGATHYTHWFQPLTGLTAEKHDSFISPTADGRVMMEFSGKELIQGEPDASSFPSGGLRATFEARGYTAWDTTSPAFLKEDSKGVTLYIPTAFVSYTGEALDKKTPLLRSMDALNVQALRVLKLLGNTTTDRVITTVGPEQEYFLVEKEYFEQRPDLLLSGRTLFGQLPSKGQEMDDHYFGAIKERVSDFMSDFNQELWKLGIAAKTQHNEVAPNQFELATLFNSSNVSADSNQVVMETIKRVASRHDLCALLHEKPFAGVNGSGKHNNWSMATDDGLNLLEPGDDPQDNAQFLLFLAAVIKAVDTYAPLLRASAANSGNDHRLGANEAPPAIISIFLGDQLSEIIEKLAAGEKVKSREGGVLEIGATCLPGLPKDLTDRNRTSPFAFTGNKFEFRMVPSSESISGANVVLNTAVAEILSEFAHTLEKSSDKNQAIKDIVIDTYKKHKRVIFNGNGYSDEWLVEAGKRKLPNLKSTVEALHEITSPDSIKLFEGHKVFTKAELESREHIYLEKYSMQINIEASVMVKMAKTSLFPAANEAAENIADAVSSVSEVLPKAKTSVQQRILTKILEAADKLYTTAEKLEQERDAALGIAEVSKQAHYYRETVFATMNELRAHGDELEAYIDSALWPFPTYEELLFKL